MRSVKCRVCSAKCGVQSVECGVRSGVWDVEWEVGNGKRGVCSAECEV